MRKTSIFGHFGQKWPILDSFWTVFGKMGETGFFQKKSLGTFFPPLQALTNCRVSEKSNERISRYFRTNRRTNGRELNSRFLRIKIRRNN